MGGKVESFYVSFKIILYFIVLRKVCRGFGFKLKYVG